MDFDDDPNTYEDILVPAACDLIWAFSLEPWDQTGGSAVFVMNGVSYAMTIVVTDTGDDKVSEFSIRITPSTLATAGAVSGTVFNYLVRATMTNGQVQQLGYGTVVFQ